MENKQIRKKASDICKKNSGILVLISLIYIVITTLTSHSIDLGESKFTVAFSTLSVAGLFITGPMIYGFINVIVINHSGNKPAVKDLFGGFKYFWKLFVLHLLVSIYTILWSLLFIVPGIIKGLSYSKAFHIFYDDPSLSPRECIKQSMELMDGNKWKYFCLEFGYIGWYILCALTLGVLTLWVTPKVETAAYIFYEELIKNEKEETEDEMAAIQEESSL